MDRENDPASLYLFPVPLSLDPVREAIPSANLVELEKLDLFYVENIRTARRFLKKMGYTGSLDEEHFRILDKHTPDSDLPSLLQPLKEGRNAGLMSESGVPCIADPGSRLVREAQENGIRIVPLSGPSSIILGLMASGLNGQQFTFHGYLPVKSSPLRQSLASIEKQAMKGITQIFIEAPYRNQKLLAEMLNSCRPETLLCIASEITGPQEFIRTKRIRDWQKQVPDIHKKNTIFLLGFQS